MGTKFSGQYNITSISRNKFKVLPVQFVRQFSDQPSTNGGYAAAALNHNSLNGRTSGSHLGQQTC